MHKMQKNQHEISCWFLCVSCKKRSKPWKMCYLFFAGVEKNMEAGTWIGS
jgi:hypothetical protein